METVLFKFQTRKNLQKEQNTTKLNIEFNKQDQSRKRLKSLIKEKCFSHKILQLISKYHTRYFQLSFHRFILKVRKQAGIILEMNFLFCSSNIHHYSYRVSSDYRLILRCSNGICLFVYFFSTNISMHFGNSIKKKLASKLR